MVDDGDVRFFRLLPCLLHEAFFKESAVAAKAVFRRRGDARQYRRVFRDFCQGDQIAVGGFVEEALYRAPPRFFFGGVRFAVEVLVVVVVAEVVAPPFEQGDARGGAQHFAYQRQVFGKNLLLQVACCGRDQPFFAAGEQRQEVGEGFAGAGACFCQQNAVVRHVVGDGFCQFLLPRSRLVIAHRLRQRAIGGEQGLDVSQISTMRLWSRPAPRLGCRPACCASWR